MKGYVLSTLDQIAFDQRDAWRAAVAAARSVPALRRHKLEEATTRHNWFLNCRLLFVHIPKTAGTSAHRMLTEVDQHAANRQDMSEDDFNLPHKHAKASEWRSVLGDKNWRDCFSFCFVRNPWDLMVSSYCWWVQYGWIFPKARRDALHIRRLSFDQFIHSDYGRYYINEFHGAMSDWFQVDGRDLLDFVGRVEHFNVDMRHVIHQTGINPDMVTIPHLKASERGDYRRYYSESGKRIVADRFAHVIERFGYQF